MKKVILGLMFIGSIGLAQASGNYNTCIGCHGANGEGGVGPAVAGSDVGYLIERLTQYRAGEYLGPMTAVMAPLTAGLSDEDIQELAEYMNGL